MVVVEAQMSVRVVIPTVESRLSQANELAIRTGGEIVIDPVGDGSERSASDNHVRAMLYAPEDYDWIVILEDDAVVSDSFLDDLESALSSVVPKAVVSLYLGRGRPASIQPPIQRTVDSLDDTVSWLQMPNLYWGVGVAINYREVHSVADYVLSSPLPWDTAVGRWCLTSRTPVLYTWPSLVDHRDTETTINHADGRGRAPGRVAWSFGSPTKNGTTVVVK